MTTCECFAKRLKELRKEAGIRQDDIAKDIGVTKGTVSKWETGSRMPEMETLEALAEYYSTTLAYLTGQTDERYAPGNMTDEDMEAGAAADEAERLKNMISQIARLSEGTRRIVAATVSEAYKRDAACGLIEAEGRFEISIKSCRG